jgi:hypothetical protein
MSQVEADLRIFQSLTEHFHMCNDYSSANYLCSYPFQGTKYRIVSNWYNHVIIHNYRDRPIKYLEVGCLFGANIISFERTYGYHPNSELTCIDPWSDYDDYFEYKGEMVSIYDTFLSNIANTKNNSEKFIIKRDYSHNILPLLDNDYYDIIYIDGNHEPEYVLEDATLAFRKLKIGGIMIFDDYFFSSITLRETSIGVDAFLHTFSHRIENLGVQRTQIFIKKVY